MIISHKHKFIFLKTKKTGGTSLEILLSKFAGSQDVITRLDADDENLRSQWGGRAGQNYWPGFASLDWRAWRNWAATVRYRLKTGRQDRNGLPFEPYRQHMPADQVRRKVGDRVWNEYFKFAVERNPWDRAVSTYYWRTRSFDEKPYFREFVLAGEAELLPRNYDIYSIRGLPAVDRVVSFDALHEDMPEVLKAIGLPENAHTFLEKIRAKGQYRPGREYRSFYDSATREAVELQFAQEIRLMGYRF